MAGGKEERREADWDCVASVSDLDHDTRLPEPPFNGAATVRGKKGDDVQAATELERVEGERAE